MSKYVRPASTRRISDTKRDSDPLQGVFRMALVGSLCLMGMLAFGAFCWEATYANGTLELPTLFGVFGDFLSGVLAPLLSLVSIYFVVVTLREQREGDRVKTFENRYYQLLRIHRDNAREMEFGESFGRRAFVRLMEEINLAMSAIDDLIKDGTLSLSFKDQLHVAYYCVFFGVGPASSASLRPALDATGIKLTDDEFNLLEAKCFVVSEAFRLRPFQGHQSSLGHYYRHLYQTISFVHLEGPEGKKLDYVKSIRAQLSNYEQALLLINSLTGVGWDWWNDGYIEFYGLVKNLPRGFVEIYCRLDVENIFPTDYFEWQQSSGAPETLSKVRETQDEALVEEAVSTSQRLAKDESEREELLDALEKIRK